MFFIMLKSAVRKDGCKIQNVITTCLIRLSFHLDYHSNSFSVRPRKTKISVTFRPEEILQYPGETKQTRVMSSYDMYNKLDYHSQLGNQVSHQLLWCLRSIIANTRMNTWMDRR